MTCPICNEETDHAYRPFCSKRCADIDLGRWFSGAYRVPLEEADETPGEADPAPPTEH